MRRSNRSAARKGLALEQPRRERWPRQSRRCVACAKFTISPLATPLRIDPQQRFACSQCGRCCHRFDVVVSPAEIELYRKRNAGQWFSESGRTAGADRDMSADLSAEAHRANVEAQRAKVDPFEPIPGLPALQRIRK